MGTFAKRLVYARKVRDLTQDQLASLIGVERQAVTNWERGKGANMQNVRRAAEKLACDFAWLATGEGPPPVSAKNPGSNVDQTPGGDDILEIYNGIRNDLKQAAREALRALRDYQPK